MKRFLVKTGISFLAVFAFAFCLDAFITHNLRHSTARMFNTYNAIYSDSLVNDAVIMGSSRGLVQFDVNIIDSITGLDCYNISVDGRCIDAEIVMYQTYCQHAPRPKVIIQNIDRGTLKLSDRYEREQYLPYLDRDGIYEKIRERDGFKWTDRWLPLVRYSGYLEVIKEGFGISNKLEQRKTYKGYVARDEKWDGSAFYNMDTILFETHPMALAMFDSYLAQCKEEGVQVVLVYSPIYSGVTQKMGASVQEMFDCYKAFAERYHYPILNYIYDSICYDTACFYNASHLNRFGAELFSTKLALDLKELVQTERLKYIN